MGFTAIGEMATGLARVRMAHGLQSFTPRIAEQIKEAISAKNRSKNSCPEALQVPLSVTLMPSPGLCDNNACS